MSDIIHISNALTLLEQKNLVKWFLRNEGWFYIPQLRTGHYMKLKMCCLGMHWNPKDYQYHNSRNDFDNELVPSIPSFMLEFPIKYCKKYFPEYDPAFDICIVNYYSNFGKLGMHRDNSESKETLDSGHPVVSISIGAEAEFKIHDQKMILKSGDVVMFGRSQRLAYHGITRLNSDGALTPFYKFLNCGRLNFTFRKY